MNTQPEHSHWLRCPICGKRVRNKVYKDTVLINYPLYCPACRREIKIDVIQFKMVRSKEPEA
ncbi:MAG: conjugal transfer protein [Clostridia bacterium]|nr:conjugal transfer protein [Clostridia bacterium]